MNIIVFLSNTEMSRSWSSAHDWKSCRGQKLLESSNLSISAKREEPAKWQALLFWRRWRFIRFAQICWEGITNPLPSPPHAYPGRIRSGEAEIRIMSGSYTGGFHRPVQTLVDTFILFSLPPSQGKTECTRISPSPQKTTCRSTSFFLSSLCLRGQLENSICNVFKCL